MRSKVLKEMESLVSGRWGEELCASVMDDAAHRYEGLCMENRSDSRAVKEHTEKDIFPCISLYRALQANGISAEDSLSFLDESWSRRAEAGAESMRKILRFAGLYRLYPRIFTFVAKKKFGKAAGFTAEFHDCGKYRSRFDMTRCLFCDVCERYGCPELTKCFCHVDDVNNTGLHPRLRWNRTKYMGGGGDCCDFDIYVDYEDEAEDEK